MTVFGDHLPVVEGANDALNSCDFLAEAPLGTAEWGAGVVRRLIGASTGPVAVDVRDLPVRFRLEQAGWFVAARDAELADASESCWPLLTDLKRIGIGYGSCRPKLVLIGDRVTHAGQLPFTSKSGVWLFLALRLLGYDELDLYLANSRSLRGIREGDRLNALHQALGDPASGGPTWVGLGKVAQQTLRGQQIPHAELAHPSHMRRFKYKEEVAGYAARFLEAGVTGGVYDAATPLYVHEVKSLPVLPEPYAIHSLQTTGRKSDRKSGTEDSVNPVERERARRAFVTGEARTISDAARLAGGNVTRIRQAAKDEGWRAEREDHQRRVTETSKRDAERSEALAIAETRSLAWRAVKIGMTDVVERLLAARGSTVALERLAKALEAGDKEARPLHVGPSGLESLTRVAMSLTAAGVGEIDVNKERIYNMPLGQLAQETLKVLKDQFGDM